MRLDSDRITVWIEHQIPGERQVPFPLEECLGRIIEENIVDNFIPIGSSGSFQGKMAYENIRSRSGANGRIACFCKDVIAQDSYARRGRCILQIRAVDLMLDFDVVADCVDDQVILDEAPNKWGRTIGIA